MNKKYLFFISVACVLTLVSASNALAKPNEARAEDENEIKMEARVGDDNEREDENRGVSGTSTSEQHRSAVADVAQKLKEVAEKDGSISEEVKQVAQEENDTSEKIKEKMEEVENRSSFRTFLFGSDYRNLGALRSELVTTANHIDRLTKSLDRMTSSTLKTELETQITELEAIETKAENFVKANESKFSLFGWLVRLFQ